MQEMLEMRVWSLSREDPPEEGMATHSRILAWRIPGTEEPGGLQSTRSHGWAYTHTHLYVQTHTCAHMHTPLSVPDFLPLGERRLLLEMKTDNRCSFGWVFVFCVFFFSLLASFQLQTLSRLRFPSDGGEQCWTGFITCGKQKSGREETWCPCKGQTRKRGAHVCSWCRQSAWIAVRISHESPGDKDELAVQKRYPFTAWGLSQGSDHRGRRVDSQWTRWLWVRSLLCALPWIFSTQGWWRPLPWPHPSYPVPQIYIPIVSLLRKTKPCFLQRACCLHGEKHIGPSTKMVKN